MCNCKICKKEVFGDDHIRCQIVNEYYEKDAHFRECGTVLMHVCKSCNERFNSVQKLNKAIYSIVELTEAEYFESQSSWVDPSRESARLNDDYDDHFYFREWQE